MRYIKMYSLLPFLYLFGFALSSSAFRAFYGLDLSFIIVALIVAYYGFIYKHRIRGGASYLWWFYLLVVPSIVVPVAVNGDVSNMIYCTLIIMLPFALEPFVPGDDKATIKGFNITYVVSVIILLLYANLGFLSRWNPNCIAYLIFLGIAGCAVVLSDNRKKKYVWVLFGYAIIQLMVTQSRNVISALVFIVLLVMFKKTFSKKNIYRLTYIATMLYPVLLPKVTGYILRTDLYYYLKDITQLFFSKNSVFSGRDGLFVGAEKIISSSLIKNIFGYGQPMTNIYSPHNDYLMIRYAYGIIGTLVIVGMFVYFFEKAYTIIKKGDDIAYGCTVVVLGIVFQQASEGWLIAGPLPIFMAFVYMAIVIKRYRIGEGRHLSSGYIRKSRHMG